ncbi:hypothetical protein, partial [Janthinobacterium sp. PSPC2-1]|uniref:hypothetical protein n=1 Tax=unclassified Janthinobacterium TaxID=2610881 RepID=UPI003CF8548C
GGYGIQLPGLDMPTKILTAVDTVRNIANGMKGIIQGRISAQARNPTTTSALNKRGGAGRLQYRLSPPLAFCASP